MIYTEKQGFKELAKIALPGFFLSIMYAILFFFIEEYAGDHIYKVSGQIGSVFGLAVAFFLGFRMNSAYDRWWEARKIFGELLNNSKSFSTKSLVYFRNTGNLKTEYRSLSHSLCFDLLEMHKLFLEFFEIRMRQKGQRELTAQELGLLQKYGFRLVFGHDIPNEILIAKSCLIESVFATESHIEKSDLMQHINRFYDIQGKADRIRNTPFLKIYGAFTRFIVFAYVAMMPLFIGDIDFGGEDSNYEFLAIPIMVLISTVFLTINTLANYLGEPFSDKITSINIHSICSTIRGNITDAQRKFE
jgi:putative membrane protein